MFQMDIPVVQPILTVFMLVFLMLLMVLLYAKLRVFPVILVLFVFSMVFGSMSLSIEMPLTPYFQVFFILIQTTFFLLTVLEVYRKK